MSANLYLLLSLVILSMFLSVSDECMLLRERDYINHTFIIIKNIAIIIIIIIKNV